MWFAQRPVPHDGVAPAAPLTTQFDFPCGRDFYDTKCRQEPCFRSVCAPPNFQEYWWSTVGYYSPAICPGGYTVGCSRWHSVQGPKVEKTETAMMCVPSGYTCGSNPSFAMSATSRAPMIQIRWAESDLPHLETHPMTPGAPAWQTPGPGEDWADLKERQAYSTYSSGGSTTPYTRSTSVATAPYTGTSSSAPTDVPNSAPPVGGSDGLSQGAKIGLGVGISLGMTLLLGLGALLVVLYRRKRMREGQLATSAAVGSGYGQWPPEMDGREAKGPAGNTLEPSGPPPVELRELGTMRAESYPSELGGQPRPYEVGAAAALGVVPELAAYPYPHGTVVEGQGYEPNEQYGPSPPPQTVYVPPQSGSPQQTSYTAYNGQQQLAVPQAQSYSPALTSSTAVEAYSVMSSPPQQLVPQQAPTHSSRSPVASLAEQPGHPAHSPMVPGVPMGGDPGDLEYARMMEEHAQLEQQRQTLLQLQQIEQQQAALRDRMAAAQAARHSGNVTPERGSSAGGGGAGAGGSGMGGE